MTSAVTSREADGSFGRLIADIRACEICAPTLPLGPRPIVRGLPSARLMIISQAPGTLVHTTGLSFNDRSGDRLRQWLAVDRATFYDEAQVAIVGMGFCYPGRDARGGDLPPRPECAPLWHPLLLPHFTALRLTLLVGGSAIRRYVPDARNASQSATLLRWREFLPRYFVLPHPSWRTIAWERSNPWFADALLPELQQRVVEALA